MRTKDMRKMKEKELESKIQELHAELGKMRMASAKGTLRKDSGKIRPMKRDVARIMTILNEVRSK